jgi:Phasin protein
MESASKSVAMASSPMNDAAQQALAITEKNLKAAFEHARKLMNAKDINEGDAPANRISAKSVWYSDRTIQADKR